MANTFQLKRGTAAGLATLASANGILPGEPYFITDEGRIAIGLTTSTFSRLAKLTEAGGSAPRFTVDDTAPTSPTPNVGDWWLRPADGILSVLVPATGGNMWHVPIGMKGDNGTSAVPGGNTNQVQYNASGALGGAASVEIENGILRLNTVAAPVSPAVGGAGLFSKVVAGRNVLGQVTPYGTDLALQSSFMRNRISRWAPVSGGTAILSDGPALTATGTLTAVSMATTNRHTYMRRAEYLVTTAATTAVAGWRTATLNWARGANAGDGGFHYVCQWGPATGVSTTTNRCFVGLASSTAAPTDVEPSTLTNVLGFGWGAADTNVQFYTNATGTMTVVDMGSSFPVPTADRTKVYETAIYCPANGTTIFYEITDLATGAKTTGSVNANLPGSTTLLGARGWMSVGGTSSVIGIALMGLYIETDY